MVRELKEKMLPQRTATILKSIVSQYIARATPVPSQSIINDYELAVSPATIRNEMARLEKEGYITRPHTSAGSMPTDKGYRYYVESLADIELPLAEQMLIKHLFHQVEGKLEQWLSLAASLSAQLAHNMAVVTLPRSSSSCQLKHLELIAIKDTMVLAVVVLYGAKLRQQLVVFEQPVSQPELTAVANKLNKAYSGLSREKISALDVKLSDIEQQFTDHLFKIMQAEDEQV